jgi:hypothetical protein
VNRPGPQVPWALSDARTTFFTTFGGLAGIVLAWWGASGTGRLNKQVMWMVVGIVAVIGIGIGNFFWLLAGRRAVGGRRRALVDALDAATLQRSSPSHTGNGSATAKAPAHVTVAGTSRYHRPSCHLVRGKPATPVRDVKNLTACEMCQP